MNPSLDMHDEQTDGAVAEKAVRVDAAVEKATTTPKTDGNESQTNASKSRPSVRSAWQDVKQSWSKLFGAMRYNSVRATPDFLVNNSSNILGAAHVATEMMMFKSGMAEGEKLVSDWSKPKNWLVEPLTTLYSETFKKSKVYDIGGLFKGNLFKNITDRVVNLEDAAKRYRARPENLKKIERGETVKLSSPWQFRSTFAGLVVWTLSSLIPEKKDTDEEVERMVIKRNVNPLGYVTERLKQAVWFPDWPHHKRQMIGLGYALIGLSSIIGSWRGRTTNANGIQEYTLNKGYLGTSIISLFSSIPLLFASDEQRGYGAFGSIMLCRLPFLGFSIADKISNRDPGRYWYSLSSASFQAENLAQALIGGAEKHGNMIVDHADEREHAKNKAQEVKRDKAHRPQRFDSIAEVVPSNKVTAIAAHDAAMPDRVEAKHKEMAEATV